ncbi:MAG: type II secretion system F family protein [Amylibacter sp.]
MSKSEISALLKKPEKRGLISLLPFIGDFPLVVRQAGLTIKPGTVLLLCAVCAAITFTVSAQFVWVLYALGISVVLCVVLPLLLIYSTRKKRLTELVTQLPDTLDLMARGLKIGHPLNASIEAVAREMPDPIGTEFGVMFDQISYGDELVDAFYDLAERVELEDMRYLAVSVGIQHGTGGDLARVLSVLSTVIRDRIAMRRRIQAISSEGRLSANFLSCLPIIIFIFTSLTAPSFYAGISQDPLYVPMITAIIILVIANFVALRKLVNFRI